MSHAFVYFDDHFKTTLSRDVQDLLIGEHIGTGSTRAVYQHATQPDAVVKLENGAYSFHNIYEHQVWEHVKDTEFAKWFAPVLHIASNGSVMIQRKTEKVGVRDLPERIPAFFTDIKAENFGWLEGRIVCHDYGFHKFIERGMTKRMRLAHWDAKDTKAK